MTFNRVAPPRTNSKLHIDQAWFRLQTAIQSQVTMSVANIADLGAVTDVPNGNLMVVRSLKAVWMRDSSSTATVDGITIIASADGGRWIRQTQIDPSWASQSTWYVNSLTGNDENNGYTSGTSLKTLSELGRRINDIELRQWTTVHIQRDTLPTDTPNLFLRAIPEAGIELIGTLTQVLTATVATWTRNLATNDPGTVSLTGWTPANHIGNIIHFTNGTAVDHYAWIIRDEGGGEAIIGDPIDVDAPFGWSAAYPSVGNTAVLYTIPTIKLGMVEFSAPYSSTQFIPIRMKNLAISSASIGNWIKSNSSTNLINVRSGGASFIASSYSSQLINCSGEFNLTGDVEMHGGAFVGIAATGNSYVLMFETCVIDTSYTAPEALIQGLSVTGRAYAETVAVLGSFSDAAVVVREHGNLRLNRIIGTTDSLVLKVYEEGSFSLGNPSESNVVTSSTYIEVGNVGALTFSDLPRVFPHVGISILSYIHGSAIPSENIAGSSSDISVGIVGNLTANVTRYALQNLTESATPLPKLVVQNSILGNLRAYLGTDPSNTSTVTINVLVNGVATLLTCQIAGTSHSAYDTNKTHRTLVVPGDRIDIQVVTVTGVAFNAADLSVNLEMA